MPPRAVATLLPVLYSWLPFTASVLVPLKVPAVRLVIFTALVLGGSAPPSAPSVIVLPFGASYFTAMVAVLAMLLFSADNAPPTVVCCWATPTVPRVSTLFTDWLKPVTLTWIPGLYVAPPPSTTATD